MACDEPSLQRFFRTLPIPDRCEAHRAYNELNARLPRRGVALPEHVRTSHQKQRRLERQMHEVGLGLGLVMHDPKHARYMAYRATADAARRHQCACFVQAAVLAWLYRPPNGPMVRRMEREVAALVGER
jgi:hypothetical protein